MRSERVGESGERRLLRLLPAVYRREGGEWLSRYLQVAQELLEGVEEELRRWEDPTASLPESLDGARPVPRGAEGDVADPPCLVGTPIGLVDWLAISYPRPAVWTGLQARPLGRGRVEMSRAGGRAVVLAWPRARLGSVPADFDIPPRWLPVGVRIHALMIEDLPSSRAPIPGARLKGEIFWSWRNAARRPAEVPS